jgi:Glutathione-dependent formaldehyde-activating enzyme
MSSTAVYPLAGGCDCRRVRYQLEGPPLFVHCCHCRWCQRETGASFALNAMIEADGVTLLGAEPEVVNTLRVVKARRSPAAPSAASPSGATTRAQGRPYDLSASERSTNRTTCRLTYTFSLRPNSPGWFCRQGLSTTIASNTGPLRVWCVVKRWWQGSPRNKQQRT